MAGKRMRLAGKTELGTGKRRDSSPQSAGFDLTSGI